MTRSFALTWDYRCPFARIVHDHVVTGLQAGADWDVRFLAFSLGQSHVGEGEADVWDRADDAPDADSGLLALQLAVAIRDTQPDTFLDAHHALFAHRHVRSGSLRDRDALSKVIVDAGVDVEAAWAEVASGRPKATIRDEHTSFAASHDVWGVPTFVVGSDAVFVRLMDRAGGDGALAIATIDRVLDNIEWPTLNEFKHTSIPN
jgi:predicted DsbA family dithiol-disulfide isomerase